jgi:hypothetical protein
VDPVLIIDRLLVLLYPFMVKVAVLKLILQRFIREFGRSVFSWLVVPILVLITLNLFMLMVVYMECWSITAVDGTRSFTAPFAADAILYLKKDASAGS